MAQRVRVEDDEKRLTPEELTEFRDLLLTKRSKILAGAKDMTALTEENELRVSDEVDLASAEYEAAFEYRLRDREKYLLKKIENALDRINTGEYDECETCGNIILRGRLRARPETTLCIDCKEEQEKRERMYEKKRTFRPTFEF
jgi:DnaK suppressor protein